MELNPSIVEGLVNHLKISSADTQCAFATTFK